MQTQTPTPASATPPGNTPAITPEAVASALNVLGEVAKGLLAKPEPVAADLAQAPATEATAGPTAAMPASVEGIARFADVLELPPAAQVGRVREPLLTSSRFWTMIGTVATLAVQHPIGFELSPITQVCIAGVAGIYIAARTIKGGRRIEA